MSKFRDANIRLLSDADPSVNDGIQFCYEHDVKGNSLLLAGKSYGAADITIEVLQETAKDLLRYDRIGLFTIDLYGHRYRHRRNPDFNTVPVANWFLEWQRKRFLAINIYHRNGGVEGALIEGAKNVRIADLAINHMNIVTHETVKQEFEALLRWILGRR